MNLTSKCISLEEDPKPQIRTKPWTCLVVLLSHLSRVQLCATPQMAAHQAPLSLGSSRQEHRSGLPFTSPMHASEKWKWSRSVMSDSSQPHGLQPTRLLRPWEFPGKSTGVGCHCLVVQWLRIHLTMQETWVQSLGWEDPLEKGTGTHPSILGEGNGNPLQCSCLENSRDGGAWWAAVYGVAQSRTRLKWLSSSSQYSGLENFMAIQGHSELDTTECFLPSYIHL